MGSQGRRFQHGHAVGGCVHFFSGFLRSGEATLPSASAYNPGAHLSIEDVQVDSRSAPSKVLVRIKASKTDPFRLGVTICLGRTGQELCPVEAILSYISRRGLAPGPLRRRAASYLRRSGERDTGRVRSSEAECSALRGPQLPYRSGHVGSCRGCGGRSYKNSR